MPIQSFIFDFDGLILDTETPEFHVWQSIYRAHGQEIPIQQWGQIIGGYGAARFDAALHLQELTGSPLDLDSLRRQHRRQSDELNAQQSILPGVLDLLDEAERLNISLAVASSSPHKWVDTHLTRLGLFDRFDKIVCADDVAPGRTKPNPDLFLLALNQLQVSKEAAVVFEDSPNGIRAAKSAGIFSVAVPNPVTSMLTFEGESLRLSSLADLNLADLLAHF
jgi:HAD superfamily hydrolase (TIGR01509 family)